MSSSFPIQLPDHVSPATRNRVPAIATSKSSSLACLRRSSNDEDYDTFRFEDELLPYLVQMGANGGFGLQSHKITAMKKLHVGNVIPDIVFLLSEQMTKSEKCTRRLLSYFQCTVLDNLRLRGPARRSTIARRLFSRQDTVAAAATHLLKHGFVRETKTGQLEFVPDALPKVKIVSVEAKLYRWSEAITQAESYLAFSHASCIALPASVILRNEHLQARCLDAGIGVISVSRSATRLAVAPTLKEPYSSEWLRVASRTE